MGLNSKQVEEIVKQVLMNLSEPAGNTQAGSRASAGIPKTAHVAMLTDLEKIEIKEQKATVVERMHAESFQSCLTLCDPMD